MAIFHATNSITIDDSTCIATFNPTRIKTLPIRQSHTTFSTSAVHCSFAFNVLDIFWTLRNFCELGFFFFFFLRNSYFRRFFFLLLLCFFVVGKNRSYSRRLSKQWYLQRQLKPPRLSSHSYGTIHGCIGDDVFLLFSFSLAVFCCCCCLLVPLFHFKVTDDCVHRTLFVSK